MGKTLKTYLYSCNFQEVGTVCKTRGWHHSEPSPVSAVLNALRKSAANKGNEAGAR